MAFMPDKIDQELLDCCPNLKIVAGALKGYDNIDIKACTERGVLVTVVPDLLTAPTADMAVALLLTLTRKIPAGDMLVRSKKFNGWRPILYGAGLQGKNAGIIGFGRLGRAIARRLTAFDLDVYCYDPHQYNHDPERFWEHAFIMTDLANLLQVSDFIFLAAPLLPGTIHLIDETKLSQIKPGAFIINVGRGSVVDEKALEPVLKSGRLAGYAADVFEFEDLSLPDRPSGIPEFLLEFRDRTVFTPHLGSATREARLAIEKSAAASIIDFLRGTIPGNTLNV